MSESVVATAVRINTIIEKTAAPIDNATIMENNEVQLVGGPCGQHGPYTFYKGFKYAKNGEKHIMTLSEFFFVKLWMDSDLMCIGELQLLWVDKNSEQVLASLRLYFLPENTPEGRMDHGEDEVLAISEKVVLRVEDLITWVNLDTEWTWGCLAKYMLGVDTSALSKELHAEDANSMMSARLTDSSLDFADVEKERKLLESKSKHLQQQRPSVLILSYPRYCRYRAIMKRLDGVEDATMKLSIINALGGVAVRNANTRVLFCKDTFDYPELEGHELLCNHLAPKLKGRPRGKRKKRSVSPGSESNESESSVSNVFISKNKITTEGGRNGLRCDSTTSPRRSTRSADIHESKDFIKNLTAFMKKNRTPMGRIPSLGYKELDLYLFYTKVQKLGGYDVVTTNRLWKSIFDDLSGNQSSTSAATVIRRHYERLLLAYERHIKGEEHKPLPVSERRRLKSKAGSSCSASDAETSEGGTSSRSGNTTPVPHYNGGASTSTYTQSTPSCSKDIKYESSKASTSSSSSSSLRSVRVKPERLRDFPIKTEATKTKSPKHEKPEMADDLPMNLDAKHSEPVTGAVAPVQKPTTPPAQATSPAEGKENIPQFCAQQAMDDDLIEVPYKPKTPEIIDLESDKYVSKTILEVKKGKLDILKEGGLEVTPVRNYVDYRIISHPNVEKRHMPPPSINATLIKRPLPAQIAISNNKIGHKYGFSPPKVVQSKSIYAPSQRTVYGDPKDLFGSQIHQVQAQAPKFINHTQTPVDLSPQKAAVVEIMRVPQIESPKLPTNAHNNTNERLIKDFYAAQPLLEGRRVSSNLEITLVGGPSHSNSNASSSKHKTKYYNNNNKRTSDASSAPSKQVRLDETNGHKLRFDATKFDAMKLYEAKMYEAKLYHHQQHKQKHKQMNDLNIPNPYNNNNNTHKMQYAYATNEKQQLLANQMIANYLQPPPQQQQQPPQAQQPTQNNKAASMSHHPYMMDPLYYQALQNLYNSNNSANMQQMAPTAPVMQMPTQEQMKMYAELMRSSAARIQFPFQFPGASHDVATPHASHQSITSSDNHNKGGKKKQ